MGANIPLPELAVQAPQTAYDPAAQIAKVQQLRSQQQEQQMRSLQIQQSQQQLQDQNTIRSLAADPKYIQKDSNGRPTGFDYDALANDATAKGVGPAGIAQLQTLRKNAADTLLAQQTAQGKTIENHQKINDEAYQRFQSTDEITDPAQRQAAWVQNLGWAKQQGADVSQFPAAVPPKGQITQYEAPLGIHAQAIADAQKQAQTTESTAKAANEQTQAGLNQNKLDIINGYKQNPQSLLSQVDAAAPAQKYGALNARTKYQVQLAMQQGDVDGAKKAIEDARGEVGGIEKETDPAVQHGKIQVAQAEAQAKMAMEGMAKPVYAYDPQTNEKSLMSQTDALRSGAKVITPVTAKEVQDDTMLNNRLADVQQKIAQYEQSLNKPINDKDRGNIAGLLSSDKLKVGAFGAELPVDRLNQALDAENIKGLSKEAQNQLISYYNAREAMVGYQRVLSGSGRSSEQAMNLNLQTLVSPVVGDHDYQSNSLGAFKQNLKIAAQGLPRIPGIKTPGDVEKEINGSQGNAAAPNGQNGTDPFAQFGGKSR